MTEGTPTTLTDSIEQQAEIALIAERIYKIEVHGWLNADDPDPEYIGHAMWQVDQPRVHLSALFNEQPVRDVPSEIERRILLAGEDFYGLMQASRLSIGLGLLWRQRASGHPFAENQYFWLHHTDAYVKLAMASERLRDLLIIACTGGTVEKFEAAPKATRNRWYATPFEQAEALLVGRRMLDVRVLGPSRLLPPVGPKIYAYIERRNKIVHEIATQLARLSMFAVAEVRRRREAETSVSSAHEVEGKSGFQLPTTGEVSASRSEVESAVAELKDWYALLIGASNIVFQVEHWIRVLAHAE